MLLQLHVRNFAIAEHVDLTFGPGFNVLTGETGAGKSIVIDALLFLLGARAATDIIRTGSDHCLVEGLFEISGLAELHRLLEELGIESDGEQLVLSREMSQSGRSRCRANGRLVTVTSLGRIAEHLVDVHGQHDHQSLLKPESHLRWLDLYAGDEALELAERVHGLWQSFHQTVRRIAEWEEKSRERARRKDLLQFQSEEIEKAQLRPGEDEELELQRNRLANAERLFEKIAQAYEKLQSDYGAVDLLGEVTELVREALSWQPDLAPILELVESAYAQAQEAAHMLRRERDQVHADPQELARVEERLALIAQLKRKYGRNVEEILAYWEGIKAELDSPEFSDVAYEELLHQRDRLEKELSEAAWALSQTRKRAALRLSDEMQGELAALALENARFIVAVEQLDSEGPDAVTVAGRRLACSERGIDRVEFFFTANPGENPRPLAKVASGGELSRLMLALKSLMARHDQVPTLVFDEVDAGVGGRTATAVAERLAHLATRHQVLVVTHLAQIACAGEHHMLVQKESVAGRTNSFIRLLNPDERVEEIARLLDGTTSQTTLQRARELLAGQAGKTKKAVRSS